MNSMSECIATAVQQLRSGWRTPGIIEASTDIINAAVAKLCAMIVAPVKCLHGVLPTEAFDTITQLRVELAQCEHDKAAFERELRRVVANTDVLVKSYQDSNHRLQKVVAALEAELHATKGPLVVRVDKLGERLDHIVSSAQRMGYDPTKPVSVEHVSGKEYSVGYEVRMTQPPETFGDIEAKCVGIRENAAAGWQDVSLTIGSYGTLMFSFEENKHPFTIGALYTICFKHR
jgi:hypothetical protein